ncbi:uncharacterized protein EI90DRAFT_3118487 [Cantharellus anzutake]|uniref:uncharacterized protein n=1 Tax=Cantharellus anzutake TaxID=1750568 RepID=UPI00190520B5|nr:uncharacterized protein EI90DRAFT_3118487 [Cantharellus anzutake]KAF8338031.1 hypothetical protein EI90DRAFT_3118487 [Cantharellus anzutake]
MAHLVPPSHPQAQVSDWVSLEELRFVSPICIGDLVVHDDWLGQVEEVFEEVITSGGHTFTDLGGRHRIGAPPAVLDTDLENVPQDPGDVLQVYPLIIAITWVAINQSLPQHIAASRTRPGRFWFFESLSAFSIFRRPTDRIPHIHDRMFFRTPELAQAHNGACVSVPHGDRTIIVEAMVVIETRILIKVLWQDGSVEVLPSVSLLPYTNVDELDCWPGDFVSAKSDGEPRAAVVQSVDAEDRTARVRWYPPKAKEESIAVVSMFEINPEGSVSSDLPQSYGVRRGDIVFLHARDSTNGCDVPRVPKIGELEQWVRHPNASWRQEMMEIGSSAPRWYDPPSRTATELPVVGVAANKDGTHWVGEVVDLRLTGEIDVCLPTGEVTTVTIDRLTVLRDLSEDVDYPWIDEDVSDGFSSSEESDHLKSPLVPNEDVEMDVASESQPTSSSGPKYEAEEERDAWKHFDTEASLMSVGTVDIDMDSPSSLSSGSSTPAGTVSGTPSALEASHSPPAEPPWKSFDVLPSAPSDHHFYSQPPTSPPSRSFSQRLNKEYRVLSTSLPSDIIIRTYEDRADLLRSLIIGSHNTPYEDAPFVIDWQLPPSFPLEPPTAHFHSWTNGNGRVNPNLYEEGKVCLSILGTWTGEESEAWSSKKSSLLQAFVSIQGLVLVREPYFCEPAFEKMRGTEEGIVSSRLYNEKVYVLARGFALHALQHPISGFSDEIHWIYFTAGKLKKLLHNADTLIARSQSADPEGSLSEATEDSSVPRLTVGGAITLKRTLVKLQTILDNSRAL